MSRETNFPVTYAVGRRETMIELNKDFNDSLRELENMNERLERSKQFLGRKETIYKELGESIDSLKVGIIRQQDAILKFKEENYVNIGNRY